MKKLLISYNSKTGTTKKYGEEIGLYLKNTGNEVTIVSIEDCTDKLIKDADIILFGCWTHGLMFFLQHPEKKWVEHAVKLTVPNGKQIGLFATYKLATGSMFKKMANTLHTDQNKISLCLKAKHGELSNTDKNLLDKLTN